MKRKYILLIPLLITIMIYIFNNQKKEITTNKSKFNIYKEVDGEYQKQDTNTFPTTGYYLNTEESSCVNGSEVSQNSDYSVNLSFNKSDKCNLYYDKMKLVTFDANGGSVNTLSKYVKPGDDYGDLPTPERSGYTFLGWNGKNIFDEESIFMAISGATYQNGYYNFTLGNAHNLYDSDANMGISSLTFKENLNYTFTINGYVDECVGTQCTEGVTARLLFIPIYRDNSKQYYAVNNTTFDTLVYNSLNNNTISYVKIGYGTGGSTYAHIKHMQIEEGNVSTEFEPYFVTSTTKVTQNKDHTLKAIWREN